MTTATTIPARTSDAECDQCVVFWDVGWKEYLTLLRVRGERRLPRMIYLDGSLFLVSPSFPHEHLKERLGRFVTEVVTGLKIPCSPSGSTTFRRRTRRGGVEGDLTYYLANEASIRGKKKINLRVDPPPDLAIEVVWSHDAEAAIEVYRRFGVPELWICEQDELRILVLHPNGQYAEAQRSLSLPVLTSEEIRSWIGRPQAESETNWVLELRQWVVEVLVPRHRELTK